MSLFCPLCGKNKSEEALFCDACSKKIKSDYEVDIPETYIQKATQSVSVSEKVENNPPITDEKPQETVEQTQETLISETESLQKEEVVYEELKPKKRRKGVWVFVVIGLLLVGGFFLYGIKVRNENLERSGWEIATKENTVNSYLTYMEQFPNGKHYVEADSCMRLLKEEESATWENIKTSDNMTELRDFIRSNPDSYYIPLVKTRLDSLSWTAALSVNTADSYSEYMLQAQSGEFKGDYFAYAEKRYEMLFQSYPVNQGELDSLRTSIGGFYSALSSLSSDGATAYLAPTVNRFFNSGAAPRERIIGELLVAGAQSQASTIKFAPNLDALQYEKKYIGGFKTNFPLIKSFIEEGKNKEVSGYIVHAELNSAYQIVSIYETKPFNDAP